MSFIPNALEVNLTLVPKTLPRAIDPSQCAFDTSGQRFLCAPYSISISQVFTGFSDTLSFELLDASGARMRAFDAARTVAVKTYATVEYVTQYQGTPLPGDLHQTMTSQLNPDGSVVLDGTQVVHSSGLTYKGPPTYKTTLTSVMITGVKLPPASSANRYPLSGSVVFVGTGAVDTVTFNGTQYVPVRGKAVYGAGISCQLDLAILSSTALTCGKDLPIVATRKGL